MTRRLLLAEGLEHEPVDTRVEALHVSRRWLGLHHLHARDDLSEVAGDRHDSGEQLVEHDATGVDVTLDVGIALEEELGGHVLGGAGEDGAVSRRRTMRDTEIADLDDLRLLAVVVEPAHDHQVLGLDVAMDDVARVRMREPRADLDEQARDAGEREPLLDIEDVAQALPVEELHRDVEEAVGLLTEVEHAREVRMIEPARRERLGLEATAEIGVALKRLVHHLHGDRHVKITMACAIDAARAALTHEGLDDELSAGERSTDERIRRMGCALRGFVVDDLLESSVVGRFLIRARARRARRRRQAQLERIAGRAPWALRLREEDERLGVPGGRDLEDMDLVAARRLDERHEDGLFRDRRAGEKVTRDVGQAHGESRERGRSSCARGSHGNLT